MCGCWQWQGFAPRRGFGRRFAFGRWGGPWYPTREDELRFWEEYQKDLEEELADVTTRIERLKKSQQKESASAA
jgi:hypothetical protein